jgi:porin
MKKLGITRLTILLLALCTPLYSTGDPQVSESPLETGASWTGDMAWSVKGGLKRGTAFLGMAALNASLSTEKAGLWRNGTVTVTAVHTHGATPSSELFGDAQISSNIEAGNLTFLMELWVRQQFGPVELTAGLQDLNSVFALSESGGLYLNSSFGINPVISGNIPAPVFPLTAPGLTVNWQITESGSFGAALFDGRPVPFENNPYNARWKFDRGDGILYLLEYLHTGSIAGLTGEYRFGLFSHNHLIERIFNPDLSDMPCNPTLGGYAIADQQVWASGSRDARLFVQAGYTPSSGSFIDLSGAIGFNIKGLIRSRSEDMAGLAITSGRFNGGAGSETALELTYRAHINGNLFIQPDMQYIINPSGHTSMTPHCLACFLRLGVTL